MSSEEALRTAVILPDEHLLIPVLNAIPEQIRAYQRHDGLSLGGNPGRLVDRVYLGVAEERTLHRPESVVLFPRRAAGIEPSLHPLHLTGDYFLLGERDHGEQQDLYLAYGVRENAFARNPVHAGDRGGGLLDYLIKVLEELNKVMSALSDEEEEDAPSGRTIWSKSSSSIISPR